MLTRMDLCWIYHDTSTAAWVKKTSIAMMSWHLLRSCLLSLGLMSNFVPPSNINQCYVRICRENLHSTTQSYNMLQPWSLLVLMFQGNKNLEPDKVWLNPTSSCDHRHSIACRMRICADSMGNSRETLGFDQFVFTIIHGIDGPFIDGLPIQNGDLWEHWVLEQMFSSTTSSQTCKLLPSMDCSLTWTVYHILSSCSPCNCHFEG